MRNCHENSTVSCFQSEENICCFCSLTLTAYAHLLCESVLQHKTEWMQVFEGWERPQALRMLWIKALLATTGITTAEAFSALFIFLLY